METFVSNGLFYNRGLLDDIRKSEQEYLLDDPLFSLDHLKWGRKFLSSFKGNFAFALYDDRE